MVISMLAIGSLSLVAFVIIEWKVAKLPMMPGRSWSSHKCEAVHLRVLVEIYRNPVVAVMLMQSCILGSVYQATLYYVPLYLQNPRQMSMTMSAAVYIPLVGFQSFISIVSGLYISHYKRYGEIIWAGFALWTL